MDLATVAAFTAAGLSLVNVAISARMTSRGHREQWRREQERPLVARSLTLSEEARGEWWDTSVAKQDMSEDDAWGGSKAQQHWGKGWRLVHDLRYEVAQLDLLASLPVRQIARELVTAHERAASRLVILVKPGQDDYPLRQEHYDEIHKLQAALAEMTRGDLGLGPSLRVPPRSLLGKILARAQE